MNRVLFIAEPFYQYADRIKENIESYLGYAIDYLIIKNNDVSNTESKNQERHVFLDQETFYKNCNQDYDVIFVLVYSGLNIELFRSFMQTQKGARKILYLWDDIKRVQDFTDIKDLFDRIISFDRRDCESEGFEFLPLFYIPEYEYDDEEKDIDFSICGTLHSDRKIIVESILKQYPNSDYKWSALLLTTKLNYLRLLIKGGLRKKDMFYISYRGIKMSESARILKKSKVVIDVAAEGQNGLTMRTIEALASKAKIITTNSDIINYDFYRKKNVCIIDRKNPVIPYTFFEEAYQNVEQEIINKYSLYHWVEKIMSEYK